MWQARPVYERYPQIWLLLGLLFIAAGLYVGFDRSISFAYFLLGGFCCVFGVALFVLRKMEPSKPHYDGSARKPIDFDSSAAATH